MVSDVADDEPAHPKGIQYKPTSGVLHYTYPAFC